MMFCQNTANLQLSYFTYFLSYLDLCDIQIR